MTTADMPPLPRKWWENFTDAECRDPMGTLYDAQQEMYKATKFADEAKFAALEWQKRVEELRKLIHQRIGAKP